MFLNTYLCDDDIAEGENSEFSPPGAELDEFHHKATRTLFVGNLEKAMSKELLRDFFSKFGYIIVSFNTFVVLRNL